MHQCFICGNRFKKNRIVKARLGYYYLVCPVCTGGNLAPRQKALKALKKAYQSDYFNWAEAKGIRKYLNKFQLYTSYFNWIDQTYHKRPGRLLDVGAGIPDFVVTMKKRGWDCYALEISAGQVKLIKKYLAVDKVWQGDFEKKKIGKDSFDVLTFWHMLEHLTNPVETIIKANIVLKKNGYLFAEFPNFDSQNLALFRENYCHFDLPGHLVYYNKKSLEILFRKGEFKDIKIYYPLKLNGSFSLMLSQLIIRKTNNPKLANWLFYFSLPLSMGLSIINSFLGKTDLMRVSARKV